jgi:hypothetical protein
MRRLGTGLFALALIVMGAHLVGAPWAAAATGHDAAKSNAKPVHRLPTRVSLYGDSLAYESRAAFAARMGHSAPGDLTVSTYPMTAPCDYRNQIASDLVRRRPQVVVLEFSGNSATPCMLDATGRLLAIGSTPWRQRYIDDLRAVLDVARVTDTTVIWATAPPVHHPPAPDDYPRRIAAAVRGVAATNHRLRVVDTGAAVAGAGRAFTRSEPCRPHEGFCHDGRIVVRADDGLHFDCHGTPDALLGCTGYSAGARRFGDAMADAAIAGG